MGVLDPNVKPALVLALVQLASQFWDLEKCQEVQKGKTVDAISLAESRIVASTKDVMNHHSL